MKEVVPQIYRRLLRLLRWRLWIIEKLRPSPWQEMLAYAAVAGILGALAALLFRHGVEIIHYVMTGTGSGMVDSFRELEWWQRLAIPAVGGLMAGLVLLFGKRLHRGQSSTDYMEAILIGSGELPVRATLVKSTAAMFSIASGGSIGREGPMVQLAAVAASQFGRWRQLSAPQLRLLVACGAASGIASAYNAPIAGSFFVAEIILGTIAMESLGPLAVAAVAATLTVRTLSDAHTLYTVPAFTLHSLWEIGPFLVLGAMAGVVAPWFLRSLRQAEQLFAATSLPVPLRLALGGLVVGGLAVWVPEVCGNGYSVVLAILNGHLIWQTLVLVLVCKWVATAASFGSGAPGGVFTPTLFMGAAMGYLFGFGVNQVWPQGAADPGAFALVGMGALLAAASHAPVMAIIMLFEMTLSYDIIMPLMVCSVVAYYTARGIENQSLYSEALKKKAAEAPEPVTLPGSVADLTRSPTSSVTLTARFEDIARQFLSSRHESIYVTDAEGKYAGLISLHDIKPHLNDEAVATLVIAEDLRRDDVPSVAPAATLADALRLFAQQAGQTLPVVDPATGRLTGVLVKNDLLLALLEGRGAEKRGATRSPWQGS
ncbi:Voltage-gated ClC-type chloride channel ClcB [Lacunisphaera limnophila]|uniref:Voltage-gated ClC-type chloride channel ClcB n=1 Tax=Lacunisphaera limnophila TaxID=1838286 RepID=A0A1D8AWE9_9BACT|nr:Voltage-gated ClC-type chloride channel ClcB [Lacunisphaera limnophila]